MNQHFYFTSLHEIDETLPKFLYSEKPVLEKYLGLEESKNMLLRKFEWKVSGHNFSQNSRNITEFSLFAICGLRHLFRHLRVQITCF